MMKKHKVSKRLILLILVGTLLATLLSAFGQPGPVGPPPPPPPGPPGPPGPPPPPLPPLPPQGPPPQSPPDLPPREPVPSQPGGPSGPGVGQKDAYGPSGTYWSKLVSGIPDSQANEVRKKGFGTKVPNVPPFGLDTAGNPLWPIGGATPIFTPGCNTTPSSRGANAGRGETPATAVKSWNNSPAKMIKGTEWTPVAAEKSLPPSLPARNTSSPPTDGSVPDSVITEMKAVFLVDSERHARFVYENKWSKALAVTSKWESLSQLLAKDIERITGGAGPINGFPSFQAFIHSAAERDLEEAKRQGFR